MLRLYSSLLLFNNFMISQQDIHSTLESTFTHILRERMDGVPVINDKLSVKAIGFHQWNNTQLGILITPWFMNLMLFPQATDDNNAQNPQNAKPSSVGDILPHVFPSGAYDFVVGYEDSIGQYQSCSLFSPMFEFKDQPSAELTAKEALAAIMNEDNIDFASQSCDSEIEAIWNGKKPAPVNTGGYANKTSATSVANRASNKPQKLLSERIKERIDEPTSRRDFLRGSIFSSEDK